MNKNLILILSLLLFSLLTISGKAQGIFTTSKDLDKNVLDSTVYDVRQLAFSNKILIIYKNKTRKKVLESSIWGYENKCGEKFKRWHGYFCLIRNTGNFSTYLVKEGRYSHYYFSPGEDGDLHLLNKKNLHKVFGDNHCFMDKVDAYCKNFFHSCEDYKRKTKRLVVEEFYGDCK